MTRNDILCRPVLQHSWSILSTPSWNKWICVTNSPSFKGRRGGGGRRRGGNGDERRHGDQPQKRRCRLIISASSSSEEEFQLPTPLPRRDRGNHRQYPDYVGRRLSVPASYFTVNQNIHYEGVCHKWGRYKNTRGEITYGYFIHFDEGIGKVNVTHDMSGCSPRYVYPTTWANVTHDLSMSWVHIVGNNFTSWDAFWIIFSHSAKNVPHDIISKIYRV